MQEVRQRIQLDKARDVRVWYGSDVFSGEKIYKACCGEISKRRRFLVRALMSGKKLCTSLYTGKRQMKNKHYLTGNGLFIRMASLIAVLIRTKKEILSMRTKFGTFLFGSLELNLYLCRKRQHYGNIKFYLKRIQKPSGTCI